MENTTIKKEIAIKAPRARVWEVLLNDEFNRVWLAAFSEGSHAVTDWKLGSKVIYQDASACGMVGMIVQHTPPEVLSVEYEGLLVNGEEDTQSDDAKAVQGGLETYQLLPMASGTQLLIESDMSPEYFDMMSAAWDVALLKIKELSEVSLN
ncbi:SRPBCC domain-containing protein [Rufibacter sediminis]|uniref:SRPBCC domain-containing protein n=1 Tax=Rufibacter sediminis TaxID=2762756 RepID=A0ABR6W0K3_9BACT|nr:SRPBCC domain-containing protein [Rufibacter sediminis]MBC3542256.1 SRPBCC domain-containing protein [Rufibacter sediminis]